METNPPPQIQALKDTQPLRPNYGMQDNVQLQSKLVTKKLTPIEDEPTPRVSEAQAREDLLRTAIRKISQQAKHLLDFDHCSVYLQTQETFRYFILFDVTTESVTTTPKNFDQLRQLIKNGVPHITKKSSEKDFFKRFNSQMLMPLLIEGKAVGLFNFACRADDHYTKKDVRIAHTLTTQLASTIHSINLQMQMKQMQTQQDMLHREIEALKNEREDAREQNAELEAYAHTVAHDLKSPLGAAMVQVEMIEMMFKKNMHDRLDHYISGTKSEMWRMKEMIEQLLTLATVDNIDETMYKVKTNFVVNRAVERFKYDLDRYNIEMNVMPDMPALWGNNPWVEEVFANLISNAIKYRGDNPSPRIQIRAHHEDYRVRYEVTDNGVGIKPEDLNKLFMRFSRLHTVNTPGTGLGLSIVHRIIARLGGEVGVESVFGEGSTFWFTVPNMYDLPITL